MQERLKRCVRDFLSRKRMVAFLLLDSPQESIVDLMVNLIIQVYLKKVEIYILFVHVF